MKNKKIVIIYQPPPNSSIAGRLQYTWKIRRFRNYLPSRIVVELPARKGRVVEDERVPWVRQMECRVPWLARGRRAVLFPNIQVREDVLEQQIRQVIPIALVFTGGGRPVAIASSLLQFSFWNSHRIERLSLQWSHYELWGDSTWVLSFSSSMFPV